MSTSLTGDARTAYDALAMAYDVLAADYAYEPWLTEIERLAEQAGVRTPGRVLDVGCGTGLSFLPLLEHGWTVTGCDISPAMIARARAVADDRADLLVADMRSLPRLGRFDLVTCLDDALNYLLTEDDLRAAFASIAANLAPGGLAVWDINTLVNQSAGFASDWTKATEDFFIFWQGRTPSGLAEGGVGEAVIEVFAREGSVWQRHSGLHRQRNWPLATIVALAAEGGLEVTQAFGQLRGARLVLPADEREHPKLLLTARLSRER